MLLPGKNGCVRWIIRVAASSQRIVRCLP